MPIEEQIAEAIEEVRVALEQHPERRADLAEEYILRGDNRPHPVLFLARQADPDAGEVLKRKAPPEQSPEERLLDKVRGITGPLAMHNPVRPTVGLGKGNNPLAASFGVFLDPELNYTPIGWRDLDDVLAEGMPDPDTSGMIPEMCEEIDAALRLTPEWMEITPPGLHGPFNTAHMILGTEAFTAPLLEPEKFARLLEIITDFLIAVNERFRRWIGPARFPRFPNRRAYLCECSVNMLSPRIYEEHVLPHDLRIAEALGPIAVHPCCGPHVFYATLRHLPGVAYTEAGFCDKTVAGWTPVDDALAEIAGRPIILSIGQELPEGREEEFIRRDLDRARDNPRLLFGYTGMYWKKADEPRIRDLHLRLDDYWREQIWQE